MRKSDAADEATGTNDTECLVGRSLSTDAFEDGIGTVASRQFEDLFDAFRSAFCNDVGCARFMMMICEAPSILAAITAH